MPNEYEIAVYRPEFLEQVVELLQPLWGSDPQGNRAYFRWKYEENPFAEAPLGIVALRRGAVVGFRGYFAAKWHVQGNDREFGLLCPGDTCVDPSHRRQGLSVLMGDFAMSEFRSEYRLFLNLTATNDSVPGYLRLGFHPLKEKTYLNRHTVFGLLRFLVAFARSGHRRPGPIAPVAAAGVDVADAPRPDAMYQAVAGQTAPKAKLALVQDIPFFEWRFRNRKSAYTFYYREQDGNLVGYVVVRSSPNGHRGYIVDYAEKEPDALQGILQRLVRAQHFDVLSILDLSLDGPLQQALSGLRFKRHGAMRMLERRSRGECPALVRPTTKAFAEDDWFFEGLDMRKIDNWDIKPICSDGV